MAFKYTTHSVAKRSAESGLLSNENFSNLDKRITTQEVISRSVFLAIIGVIATAAIRYFWDNPIFSTH